MRAADHERHRRGPRAASRSSRRASSSLLHAVPSRASATSRDAGRDRSASEPLGLLLAAARRTVGARLASRTSISRTLSVPRQPPQVVVGASRIARAQLARRRARTSSIAAGQAYMPRSRCTAATRSIASM